MKTKINLFTAMIFAYSIIVCKVCKNEDGTLLLSKVNSTQSLVKSKPIVNSIPLPIIPEESPLSASNASIKDQPNQ